MPVPSISTPRARAARQHFAYVIAQYHTDKLVEPRDVRELDRRGW